MAKALSSLAVGTLVKDTGTLYNGKPIVWKIADKGHAGYPANSVTLITERIISLKCFDAIESGKGGNAADQSGGDGEYISHAAPPFTRNHVLSTVHRTRV